MAIDESISSDRFMLPLKRSAVGGDAAASELEGSSSSTPYSLNKRLKSDCHIGGGGEESSVEMGGVEVNGNDGVSNGRRTENGKSPIDGSRNSPTSMRICTAVSSLCMAVRPCAGCSALMFLSLE